MSGRKEQLQQDKLLNFNTNNVDLEALQKEIDAEIIIEDNEACDRDMLDQMTYQLSMDEKRREEKSFQKRAEEMATEIQDLHQKRVPLHPCDLMNDEERDEFMLTLNNAFLDLSRKMKDLTIYYIALKSKVNLLEEKRKEQQGVDQELVELLAQMKSYRRYNSLSDVDFDEVVRRVMVEVEGSQVSISKKPKREIFIYKLFSWKIFFVLLLIGGVLWGYLYKINAL